MTLSATALVTLPQAKNFIRKDAASSLHIDAEYVGTGNGTNITFTLDHTPVTGSLKVWVNTSGTPALQVETTNFTYATATITFVVASTPGNGAIVTASYDYAAATDTFISYDDELLESLINAATKKCEDWCGRAFIQRAITESINGTGTDSLRIPKTPIISITTVSYKRVVTATGDASKVAFALGYTPITASLLVYVDGTLKTVSTHYTLSGQVVTFTAAPAASAKIVFRFEVECSIGTDYTEMLYMGRLIGSWSKDYEYVVVYTAGYGASRAAAQAAVPDAVLAVLSAVAVWHENRLGLTSESQSGVGSVNYGDELVLPQRSKNYLSDLNRNLI